MSHAYGTVTFYNKLFKDAGLHPGEIKSVEDVTKIPIIDKKKMMDNSYGDLISKIYPSESFIPIKTAGSNGIPFLFYIDNIFDEYRKAQCLRPYITNGRLPWHDSILFSVHNSPEKKWYQNLGLWLDNYVYSGLPLSEQIGIIRKRKPAVIQGYGSVLNLLSAKIIEENISVPKPRFVFTDSELLMPEMRGNIDKAFNTNLIDIYGTYETDNIAYECPYHEGYHITIDSVIMEFIHDGNKVEKNEEGEIVVTVLNNFAMPFIRYNLHDIGSQTEKVCPCGRTFPLMNRIQGRANDYMITPDGRKLSFFNIAYFDKLAPNVREYQIVQQEINYFKIFVVPGIGYKSHAEKVIVPAIKKFFPEAEINVDLVSEIKRESSGKFKAFKSKVNLNES